MTGSGSDGGATFRRSERQCILDGRLEIEEGVILEALRAVHVERNRSAHTTAELAEKTGISERVVRRRIAELMRTGEVDVTKKTIVNMAGIPTRVPAYMWRGIGESRDTL